MLFHGFVPADEARQAAPLLMISNRQRAVRVPIRKSQEFFVRAMKEVHLPVDAVSVCLVTDSQIAKWNAAYRGKKKPTDVLSFPSGTNIYNPQGSAKAKPARKTPPIKKMALRGSFTLYHPMATYLGDIAIAPAVARRNARLYGRTLEREMRILILHGILHLMGYDHETDTGQMERRERRLRRTLGIA
jgi:probable rRNA maturation factor